MEVVNIEDAPILDRFLITEIETYAVYTYYDKSGCALYVGKSKAFYDRHYWHWQDDDYMNEVKYVGLRFYDTQEEMDIAEIYWIHKLVPKHNKTAKKNVKYQTIRILDQTDELILNENEMVFAWANSMVYYCNDLLGQKLKGLRKRRWGPDFEHLINWEEIFEEAGNKALNN